MVEVVLPEVLSQRANTFTTSASEARLHNSLRCVAITQYTSNRWKKIHFESRGFDGDGYAIKLWKKNLLLLFCAKTIPGKTLENIQKITDAKLG